MLFKRAPQLKPLSRMRSSDTRSLKKSIEEQYPNCDDNDLATLLQDLESAKFQCGEERGTIYFRGGSQPVFFALSDSKRIFPTVYAFWGCKGLRGKSVSTWGPVIRNLVNGADLMIPGLRERIVPAAIEKGDVVTIVVEAGDRETEMAVGLALVGGREMRTKGKAVEVLHVVGDALWEMGDKSGPDIRDDEQQKGKQDAPAGHAPEKSDQLVTEDLVDSCVDEGQTQLEAPPRERHPSPAEIDEWVHQTFLALLVTEGPHIKVPISASEFNAKYLSMYELDIKKTSYKKVSKFLKAYDKKGLLRMKEVKGSDAVITRVDWMHKDLEGVKGREPQKTVVEKPSVPMGSDKPDADHKIPPITIKPLYKPSSHIQAFMGVASTYMTAKDVRGWLKDYVQRFQLQHASNRRLILVNDPMTAAVYNKAKVVPEYVKIDDFVHALLERMTTYHSVQFGDGEHEIRRGEFKPIEILIEKRQGRKSVTRVQGVEGFRLDPRELGSLLQVKCAASTTVTLIPGRKSGEEVLIQGEMAKQVKDVLAKRGVDLKYVVVTDKTRK